MRTVLLVVGLMAGCWACASPAPVQDPLEYLRVGVDPSVEASTVMRDLERHGYTIGTRIEEPEFVAFDARAGVDTTVRIMTERGAALSVQTPDVRAPDRLAVRLSSLRPDHDRDGMGDLVVAAVERDRQCLAWVRVEDGGFVSSVFQPKPAWGEAPCVIEIDPDVPRLLLEVAIPFATEPGARVRLPIRAGAQGWEIDRSPSGQERISRERVARLARLAVAEASGDAAGASRLRAEIDWLDRFFDEGDSAEPPIDPSRPVLEPADDGQEAR